MQCPKMYYNKNDSCMLGLLSNQPNKTKGSSGIWTRDLSHPKRESYP